MPLPDWNNDKASPPVPFSVCSPDATELAKRAKVLREAMQTTIRPVPSKQGTIANPEIK